jgi:hypothetical protein
VGLIMLPILLMFASSNPSLSRLPSQASLRRASVRTFRLQARTTNVVVRLTLRGGTGTADGGNDIMDADNAADRNENENGSDDIFVGLMSASDRGQFLSDIYNRDTQERRDPRRKDGPKEQVRHAWRYYLCRLPAGREACRFSPEIGNFTMW